jgi:hypothetical protein
LSSLFVFFVFAQKGNRSRTHLQQPDVVLPVLQASLNIATSLMHHSNSRVATQGNVQNGSENKGISKVYCYFDDINMQLIYLLTVGVK